MDCKVCKKNMDIECISFFRIALYFFLLFETRWRCRKERGQYCFKA